MCRARRSQKWKLTKELEFSEILNLLLQNPLATFHLSCAWVIWCPPETLPNTRGFAILGRPCAAAARKVKKSEVATLFPEKVKRNARRKYLFVMEIIRNEDGAQPF